MMTSIVVFAGLTLMMLTGLGIAASSIREEKRRVSDDTMGIDEELRLNAKIRELQGFVRVGDKWTERCKTVERVGRAREIGK
jgi:hypothetical protein